MKKTMIAVVLATVAAAAPVHAISAHYRAQLERSGCTQVTEAQGCDIHKTKAQNRAAGFGAEENRAGNEMPQEQKQNLIPYRGTYGVFAPNGQRIGKIVVTDKQVRVNGEAMNVTTMQNWIQFTDGITAYTLYKNHQGEWVNADTNQRGTIGR